MTQDLAQEADAIADLVNGLAMRFGQPERFHIEKDDAAKRLRALARELRGDRRATVHVWRAGEARQSAQEAARAAFEKRKASR